MKRHASETTLAHLQRHHSKSGKVIRLHRRTPSALRSLPLSSVEPDTRIPPVRLLNYLLAVAFLEVMVVLWALSVLMERSPS